MSFINAETNGQDLSKYSNNNDYDLIEGNEMTWTEKPLGKGHIKVTRSGAYRITVWREDDKSAFKDKTLELYESNVTRLSKKYKFDRPYIEKEYVEYYFVNTGDIPPDESEENPPPYTCINTNGEKVEKPILQWEVVLYLLEGDYYIKWDTGFDFPQKVLFECNQDTYELRYDLPRYLDGDSVVPENGCYGIFWGVKDEFLKHKAGKNQYKYLPVENTHTFDISQFQVKYIFYMDPILAGVFYYTVADYIAMNQYKKKSWMDKAWSIFFEIIDKNNEFTGDERESIQSLVETTVTTVIGIVDTTTGVLLTFLLYVLNQDPKYLLPQITQGISDIGRVQRRELIKRTQNAVILKIGERAISNYQNSTMIEPAAICEKWNLKEIDNTITAYGEPYYDGVFFSYENNMQEILDVLDKILNEAIN